MGLPQQKEVGVCVMDPAYARKDLLVMPLRCETTTAKQFQCKSMETLLSYRNERRLCCAEVPLLLTKIRKNTYHLGLLFCSRDSLISKAPVSFRVPLQQRAEGAAKHGQTAGRAAAEHPGQGQVSAPNVSLRYDTAKLILGTSKAPPASR